MALPLSNVHWLILQGYYADPEAECQAFHICANFGDANLVKYSFLCPNGTLFNQQYFICDWWFNVDCSQAEDLYGLNEEVAAAAAAATAAAAGDQSNYAGQSRFFRQRLWKQMEKTYFSRYLTNAREYLNIWLNMGNIWLRYLMEQLPGVI